MQSSLASLIPAMDWNERHLKNDTPWDLGECCAALKWFFSCTPMGAEIAPQISSILVPGCGQAYDCQWLAQFKEDWRVTGMDISEEAIARCQKALVPHNCTFQVADFFSTLTKADCVFDYTFFCAIPPHRRPEWAQQMARIIPKGKYLLCLQYPLLQSTGKQGPPFAVSEESYAQVLKGAFVVSWRSGLAETPCNEKRRDRFMRQELVLYIRK